MGDDGDSTSDAGELPDPDADDAPWVDRRSGNGSMSRNEDWVRANARTGAHDGRATTRTTFYGGDVESSGPPQAHRRPGARRTWTQLAPVNDDAYARDISRGGKNFAADKRRWAQTFARQVGASNYQTDETIRIIDTIDLKQYRVARLSAEVVIMGILSLVIDRDVRPAMGDPDSLGRRAVERPQFATLLADLEMDRKKLKDVRVKLREFHGSEILG